MAARRDKGIGSYKQRKDGCWEARYKGHTCYGQTEIEIKKKLKKLVRQVDDKEVPASAEQADFDLLTNNVAEAKTPKKTLASHLTTGEWLDLWFSEYISPTLKPSSRASYYNNIKVHLKPAFADILLCDLDTETIQTMLNDMAKSGKAAATVTKCRNVLNGAMGQAKSLKYIFDNPVTDTKPPRLQQQDVDFLTPEEQTAFLEADRGNRLESLFMTALVTGMKRGELCALTWDCVDFKNKTITVKQSAKRRHRLVCVLA